MNRSTLSRFCTIALLEGISYLLLLFVAMPLKYLLDWPWAVKYIGWIHGILFISYVFYLLACWRIYKWEFKRIALFFLASLLPFAPFIVEKQVKKELYNPHT